jgi:hypothetical protein
MKSRNGEDRQIVLLVHLPGRNLLPRMAAEQSERAQNVEHPKAPVNATTDIHRAAFRTMTSNL